MIAGDSREPIRKARVDLTPTLGERRDPVYADNDGRFEFTGVVPGRYTLAAWKSGYASASYGSRSPWEPAAVVAIDPGQSIDGVELALPKGAAISGRVLDESGEPLADAEVTAGAAAPLNGRLQFRGNTRTARTDDRGEYRIGGLRPDTYFVSVSGRTMSPPMGAEGGPRMRTTFYPQAAFLSQARGVPLRAGEEIGSIDIMLAADAVANPTITGRVIDPIGGAVQATVVVAPAGDTAFPAIRSLTTTLEQGGEFRVRLTPGDYTFTARTDDMIATTRVSVDRSDVAGLELPLVKGASISGRVVFEGAAPRPPNGFEVVPVVAAAPDDAIESPRINYRPARVRADGSFVVSNLIGRVELRVEPANRGWRPKAIVIASRNVLDMPIEFKGGEDVRNVVVHMTDRTATLMGTLNGPATPNPAAAPSVLVFAFDARQAHRTRWVRPDQYGRFVVTDLSPGDYLVAPAIDVDDLHWRDASYLLRFRQTATRVVLEDGETKSVALDWPATQ